MVLPVAAAPLLQQDKTLETTALHELAVKIPSFVTSKKTNVTLTNYNFVTISF